METGKIGLQSQVQKTQALAFLHITIVSHFITGYSENDLTF